MLFSLYLKLKEKGCGNHKDCDVCIIENIEDEKKDKLIENIKYLEDLKNKFDENVKELKDIFNKIERDKEYLKLKVQNIFTKIRNTLNNREEHLLLEIDKIYNNTYFTEDIIKTDEKLQNKIISPLEKGKLINKEWDNNDLYLNINNCINLENNINDINNICNDINKFKLKIKMKFDCIPNENSFKNYLETLNSFGVIYYKCFQFKECPKQINNKREYSLSGESKNIFTKTGDDGISGTICEYELDKSIDEHKWKINLLNVKTRKAMVGVAPIDFDINSSNYKTCGWYIYCSNSCLYSGPPFNYNRKNTNLSKVNDEIIVVKNMKKRTLKFIINDEDNGDSYTDIPIDKPLFPAVLLYYQNDSVEISECE